jgi:hypothetical protein
MLLFLVSLETMTILPKTSKKIDRKICTKGYHLDPKVRKLHVEKMKKAMKTLQLKMPKMGTAFKITGTDRGSSIVGSSTSRKSTIKRYERVWPGMRDFCLMIGDYESAIIFNRDTCPNNPPPCKSLTARLYLQFRCRKEGSILQHPDTAEPYLVNGKEIECEGGWKSQSSITTFQSALSCIHQAYDTTRGDYYELCDAASNKDGIEGDSCVEQRDLHPDLAPHGPGCSRHANNPRLVACGNAGRCSKFKAQIKHYKQKVVEWYNEASRTTYFLPSDVRKIRNKLLSMDNINATMLWVMIIVGIKLHLRVEEVITLKYRQLLPQYTMSPNQGNNIDGLCSWISGKCDEGRKINMMIWDDEDCPEFSALRALLLWLAISGIQPDDGEDCYIFPAEILLAQRTNNMTGKWSPQDHYSEESMLSDIKYLYFEVCKRTPQHWEIIGKYILLHNVIVIIVRVFLSCTSTSKVYWYYYVIFYKIQYLQYY